MSKTQALMGRIQGFVEQLAQQTDEAKSRKEVLDYLKFAASFHRYSLHNTILIFQQRPHASQVAGFNKWKEMGRHVKKGEKGIAILAPLCRKKTEEDDEQHIMGFRTVYVFDVSQTDGEPLPPDIFLSHAPTNHQLNEALLSFAKVQDIQVTFAEMDEGTYGFSKGGAIEIRQNLEGADLFAVMAHELAHELLDHQNKRTERNKQIREIEAETCAYVLCEHFGVPSKAPNYLALQNANGKEVLERLEHITSTIQTLITAIESHLS